MAELLVSAGAARDDVHRTLGFSVDLLVDPDEQVPLSHQARLERAATQLTGDPAIALHLAQLCRGDGERVGVVGLLAAHSPTVGDGFRQAVRYANLLGTGIRLELRTGGQTAEFVYTRTGEHTVQGVELALADTATTLKRLGGVACYPMVAQFRHRAPGYLAEYRAVFGDRVLFQQAEDKLVFAARVLQLPAPLAQPYIGQVLDQHAAVLSERGPADQAARTRPHSRQVHEWIVRGLSSGAVGVDEAARALGVSRQTLYRRLKAEGTSFQELLDQVRHGLATEYLAQPQRPLHEVAFLLGFHDYGSFHRAAGRWFATSPRAYRQQLTEAATGAHHDGRANALRRADTADPMMVRPKYPG